MADINITQAEADALIALEKIRVDDKAWLFPNPGEQLVIPLSSVDKRESFTLDVTRSRIKLTKSSYQNRAHQAIVLIRLDVDGAPHRNPDGIEIPARISTFIAKVLETSGRRPHRLHVTGILKTCIRLFGNSWTIATLFSCRK